MHIEVWPGKPYPRGASWDGIGVNFALYSRVATRVEVCLFDPADPAKEVGRFDLPEQTDFVRHGFVPGLEAGTLYGFRVQAPLPPEAVPPCTPTTPSAAPTRKRWLGEWNG